MTTPSRRVTEGSSPWGIKPAGGYSGWDFVLEIDTPPILENMKTPLLLSRSQILRSVRKVVPSHLVVTRVNRVLVRPSRARRSADFRRTLVEL
jgi:hypothetical protein